MHDAIFFDIHANRRRVKVNRSACAHRSPVSVEGVAVGSAAYDKRAFPAGIHAGVDPAAIFVGIKIECIPLELNPATGDIAVGGPSQDGFGNHLAREALQFGNGIDRHAAPGGIGAGPDVGPVVCPQGAAGKVNVAVHIQVQRAVGLRLAAGALDLRHGIVVNVKLLQCGGNVHPAGSENGGADVGLSVQFQR